MIFGDLGSPKLPDICLTGEEKSRKNLAQETCPDRGSNQSPLRDRGAYYHLAHSGGPLWRRDRNRMDSYPVSTVDVPESSIASSASGPWQQQRCDSLHCHEEWWCSAPKSASRSPWKHSCVLGHRATSILIQERCSSFVNMALALSLWKSTFYTLQLIDRVLSLLRWLHWLIYT